MQTKTILAAVALALIVTPALAQKSRHRAQAACADNWPRRSLFDVIFSASPAPQANGCAPAVYSRGEFIGQDPDPNVRLQLRRDSGYEGYRLSR